MALPAEERLRLRQMFENMAGELADQNPVQASISAAVAGSYETIDLYETVEVAKRRPVLLFAAVRYLVLKGTPHELGPIYLASEFKTSTQVAARVFLDFCEEYSDDIARIMRNRSVQTNEVNRCVGLLPALMEVRRQTKKPLALIELGASAGLNLLFDRYRYDYVGRSTVGQPGAQVRLSTQVRGRTPLIDQNMPLVDYRVGLDLEPIDINDESETNWLMSCLWITELAREQRLSAALALAKKEWPDVREGDAVTDLRPLVDETDSNSALCIFTSWTVSWLEAEERLQLSEDIKAVAEQRELWWISFEGAGNVPGLPEVQDVPADASVLALQHLGPDVEDVRILALMQHHGAWIDWLDPTTSTPAE